MKDESMPAPVYVSPGDYAQQALPGQDRPPARLGIRHFLLWIAIVATILAIQRGLDWVSGINFRWSNLAIRSAFALVNGAAIAGLLVMASRLVRGRASDGVSPGKYLLPFFGVTALTSLVVDGVMALLNNMEVSNYEAYLGVHIVQGGLNAVVAILFAMLCFQAIRWLLFFLVEGIGIATVALLGCVTLVLSRAPFAHQLAVHNWPYWGYQMHALVMIIGLFIVVALDAQARAKRDWLYWAGVIAWIAHFAIHVAAQVSFWVGGRW